MSSVVLVAAAVSAASALIAFAPVRGGERAASPAQAARPSVVLLIAEGVALVPAAGARAAPTPNLDRLAARGRRFEAAYAQYPDAGASRASLLTGWRPERTQVWGDPEGPIEGAAPLPERFHAAGYHTMRVGPVAHGKGETAFAWDATDDAAAGAAAARRAAEAIASARTPFLLAVALGAAAPAVAGPPVVEGEGAPALPAMAVGALEVLA